MQNKYETKQIGTKEKGEIETMQSKYKRKKLNYST
jgi:hypothetical protein